MKLYTEEQVRKAYKDGNRDGFNHVCITDTYLDFVTPIELPSDEEIEKKFNPFILKLLVLNEPKSTMYELGYRDGAKWIKKQILNQNK